MAPLDMITFPVRPEWRAAARYVGHRQVGTWLREVVDDFMETGPGRYFPILPLDWHRERFKAIRTADGHAYGPHEVRGLVACCFGIYRGCYRIGADRQYEAQFTLAHVPTGRRFATLNRVRDCKALAEALAPLRMHWHLSDPDKVVGADVERFNALVREYEKAAEPVHLVFWSGVGGRVGDRR
jgi:hypothetical protein